MSRCRQDWTSLWRRSCRSRSTSRAVKELNEEVRTRQPLPRHPTPFTAAPGSPTPTSFSARWWSHSTADGSRAGGVLPLRSWLLGQAEPYKHQRASAAVCLGNPVALPPSDRPALTPPCPISTGRHLPLPCAQLARRHRPGRRPRAVRPLLPRPADRSRPGPQVRKDRPSGRQHPSGLSGGARNRPVHHGARIGCTPGTVSYHLSALHRASLVTKVRDGRYVLYQRTAHAAGLLEEAST